MSTPADPKAESSAAEPTPPGLEPSEPVALPTEPLVGETEHVAAPAEPSAAERAEAAAEGDAALDASGRERPRFLLGFPPDPELLRLSAAFEAGNYALVRAEAEKLAESHEDPAVKAAALELRRRIAPDPLAKYLLALTASLLLFLAYFAYHH